MNGPHDFAGIRSRTGTSVYVHKYLRLSLLLRYPPGIYQAETVVLYAATLCECNSEFHSLNIVETGFGIIEPNTTPTHALPTQNKAQMNSG